MHPRLSCSSCRYFVLAATTVYLALFTAARAGAGCQCHTGGLWVHLGRGSPAKPSSTWKKAGRKPRRYRLVARSACAIKDGSACWGHHAISAALDSSRTVSTCWRRSTGVVGRPWVDGPTGSTDPQPAPGAAAAVRKRCGRLLGTQYTVRVWLPCTVYYCTVCSYLNYIQRRGAGRGFADGARAAVRECGRGCGCGYWRRNALPCHPDRHTALIGQRSRGGSAGAGRSRNAGAGIE
jgi:hypothetical protein